MYIGILHHVLFQPPIINSKRGFLCQFWYGFCITFKNLCSINTKLHTNFHLRSLFMAIYIDHLQGKSASMTWFMMQINKKKSLC